jgi:ribokinase
MTGRRAVLSVGSINLDIQVRAERFPQESETLLAHDCLCAGGGKGANVALLAARLGSPARLFGRVGDDVFAGLALAGLRETRIELTGVKSVADQQTGTTMIVVREDGDKTIVLAPNANQCWEQDSEQEVSRSVWEAEPGSVLVTDLEIPLSIVHAALTAARERGLVSILDPSPANRMQPRLLALCDFLTPNPREAEELTGHKVVSEEDAVRAGRALLDVGVRNACVKLRDGGAALVNNEGVSIVRPVRSQVVDKTGAGDAFAGGLAVALISGRAPRDAVKFAVSTASFAVTRYGSQAAYPTRAELERFASETL